MVSLAHRSLVLPLLVTNAALAVAILALILCLALSWRHEAAGVGPAPADHGAGLFHGRAAP